MNSYRHIPIWENARRIRILSEFRNDVVTYFNNSTPLHLGAGRSEAPEAVKARQRINLGANQVQDAIVAAGVTLVVTWTPPPMVGGYVQRIDLIDNLFELDRYQISPNHAIGFIERAIGVYRSDRPAALRRTCNPLWWLWFGFLSFARAPFLLLGGMGFNAESAERSWLGRFFKLVFSLVLLVAALLTILHLMGWLPAAKTLLGIK